MLLVRVVALLARVTALRIVVLLVQVVTPHELVRCARLLVLGELRLSSSIFGVSGIPGTRSGGGGTSNCAPSTSSSSGQYEK